jgi:hypothetical protein
VVCGVFAVKYLLLPWQWGLKHYWDQLLDADLESDALGWQYLSGCMVGEWCTCVGQGMRYEVACSLLPCSVGSVLCWCLGAAGRHLQESAVYQKVK